MKRKSIPVVFMAALCFSMLFGLDGFASNGTQAEKEVRKVPGEELKALLDNQDVIIIDLRQEADWRQSDVKIKGALHEDPMDEEKSWAGKYPKDRRIVLYCA